MVRRISLEITETVKSQKMWTKKKYADCGEKPTEKKASQNWGTLRYYYEKFWTRYSFLCFWFEKHASGRHSDIASKVGFAGQCWRSLVWPFHHLGVFFHPLYNIHHTKVGWCVSVLASRFPAARAFPCYQRRTERTTYTTAMHSAATAQFPLLIPTTEDVLLLSPPETVQCVSKNYLLFSALWT